MGVDDGDEDRECGRCHETMHIPPGAEPSEICHDCAHSLVDELRARVAELEADAARYRWLRGKVCIIGTPHLSYQKAIFEFVNLPYPPRVAHDPSAELDAAIDAARLSGNKSKVRK